MPDGFPRELHEFSRASITAWSGRVAEALAVAEPLLESTETRVAVQAALIIELVASAAGPTGRAIELADTYFPVHLGLPDLAGTTNPGNHLVTKAVALTQAGRLDESHALAEFGYGASVANRSSIGQAWFSLELGRIALMRGDAVAAERWFREMIALCHSTGHRRPITLGLAGLAIACAYRDDADGARAAVAEMDAVPSAHIPLVAIESARARGWAAAASGDLPNARAAIVEGAEAAEALGIALGAALARFDALRLGDRSQASALRAAAEIVDSRVVELAADWAAAPDDATALAAVSEGFERIGSLMFAAEASAAAATSARKAGDTRRATALEQRADQLARRCQATTPALTTVDSVVPLTPREREIALLVAQGLSSKEVAERLFVSARTVSNHLQNAYVKLGIKRRSELAEALGRFGSDA